MIKTGKPKKIPKAICRPRNNLLPNPRMFTSFDTRLLSEVAHREKRMKNWALIIVSAMGRGLAKTGSRGLAPWQVQDRVLVGFGAKPQQKIVSKTVSKWPKR
ncbi:MAG: hypothetical protein H7833_17715 [Magnetococcus sp. DMHC-1]